MGLWNNSWVKNLPVHPLAPRRKTPGQLNPTSKDLPGWVNKVMRILKANTYIFAGIKSLNKPTGASFTKYKN